jgi:parvulin-like peptidyl-prolyl isomerase
LLLAAVGGIGIIALLVVGLGTYRELVAFPGEPVVYVADGTVTLRTFTDTLQEEMRNLQSQVAAGARDDNPSRASSQVQRLIEAQERLPEDVIERMIEVELIRQEAARRGLTVSQAEIDGKINEQLSLQRDLLNQPTPTPMPSFTPRPSPTEIPEGFEPSPTTTRTATPDPATPSPTWDPMTPTITRTPFPTRPTFTPVRTATPPATMLPEDFEKAYDQLVPQLRSVDRYRYNTELQVLRERLRQTVGANVPTSGPAAHVIRIAASTRDEALVARLQLIQFDYPLMEVLSQASDRPAHGKKSGDLGWAPPGAEDREFDDVVFSPDTPLDEWTEPFAAGNHWEIVLVLERTDSMEYEPGKIEQMKDRAFSEWLEAQKASPRIERDLSPQERQWALDRASKGIIETTTTTQ